MISRVKRFSSQVKFCVKLITVGLWHMDYGTCVGDLPFFFRSNFVPLESQSGPLNVTMPSSLR